MKKPKCKTCNDTGIEETGNNDLPCDDCPAGDTAEFNVCVPGGVRSMTGVEVRKTYNSVPSEGGGE